MKPLKKCLQTASIEHKNWKQELHKFLLNYRATPHCTTKIQPATALLDEIFPQNCLRNLEHAVNIDEINTKINEADHNAKVKRKAYADNRRVGMEPTFKIGDQLLVRQPKVNKLTSRFDPKPYRITTIKGTMITARRKDHKITRNCSRFKPFAGISRSDNSDIGEENIDVDQPIILDANEAEPEEREEPEERADHRYPARQRYRPLFYRDEQMVRWLK